MSVSLARAIALYLPQFHPIPENDSWWGKGFTEWTNTAKAKPLFKGHYQPHIPADLGFCDLRVPEVRTEQASLARSFGIEAFCYYHYWFAGRRLLHRPFDEVLSSGVPDFPFCVCWANETWSGIWHGAPKRVLVEQTYPGEEDHRNHFNTLLPAFRDPRYLRVDGRPLFWLYKATTMPNVEQFLDLWRTMARESGLGDLYIITTTRATEPDVTKLGFDGFANMPKLSQRPWISKRQPIDWLRNQVRIRRGVPNTVPFKKFAQENMAIKTDTHEEYPIVIHSFDNTPRSGVNGVVYTNPSPVIYGELLKAAVQSLAHKPIDRRIVFLKSWNEWAEGNHLEPDLRTGSSYLEVVSQAFKSSGL